MIYYDCHLHSEFSTDSDTPMEEHLKQALKIGLKGLCFTDHMDYDFPPEALVDEEFEGVPFVFDTEKYIEKLKQYQRLYPQLEIGIGVECGLQTSESVLARNEELVKNPAFDMVIGSLHLVNGMDPYDPKFWEGYPTEERVRTYFEQTLSNIETFHSFDTLGHMDYVVRVAPKGFIYDFRQYLDVMDEILRVLIKKDICLEINASGINPDIGILERYKEMGGELITVGSDAHNQNRLAGRFDTVEEMMKRTGFREYVTFRQRKPVFHTI